MNYEPIGDMALLHGIGNKALNHEPIGDMALLHGWTNRKQGVDTLTMAGRQRIFAWTNRKQGVES